MDISCTVLCPTGVFPQFQFLLAIRQTSF
ncbi:BgTH12-00490 [Blumeria graminis f. sp. triticale]|uniref:BgTH12-00490 n=1 Tax=Blumeria graminis f. sp. triticale TaxID=1689686 RepID=A0A9W4D6I2_BLUGR|nr:BgTH12-00490 [Blumeria graminis f. sp. triticale]